MDGIGRAGDSTVQAGSTLEITPTSRELSPRGRAIGFEVNRFI
jgi:hypothetical protein